MSVSDGDIIFACKQKFTPPSPDRVAEEIARSLFISTDAIVECVAERVVSDLASRGLVDQIAFAVAEKLSLRSPAQGMYSVEDAKEIVHMLERNFIEQCTKRELISGGPIYFSIRAALTDAITALAAQLAGEGEGEGEVG